MTTGRKAVLAWSLGLAVLATLGLFVVVGPAQEAQARVSLQPKGVQETPLVQAKESSISAVDVLTPSIYLPLLTYSEKPATTLPFYDDFAQGVSEDWVVFENYPGLTEWDWYWDGEIPDWGFYYYDPYEYEGYALSMYLGPGSQDWTDYEAVVRLKNRQEKIAGIWVRGSYEEMDDMQGGRVGGYYVHIKPGRDYVYLQRIRPSSQIFYDVEEKAKVLYTPGIGTRKWYHLKVRVQGANIKVWLKQEDEPESSYVQLIDWTDPDEAYMQGTVGFVAFRTNVIYEEISVTELP